MTMKESSMPRADFITSIILIVFGLAVFILSVQMVVSRVSHFASHNSFHQPSSKLWDEERCTVLRAELDGICAHLYGLTREELDYILGNLPHRTSEG